jgi:Protein of unknown function (DUF2865)
VPGRTGDDGLLFVLGQTDSDAPAFIRFLIEPASCIPGLTGIVGPGSGFFVTRMDSSLALPLRALRVGALQACRSLCTPSLIRVLAVAALILAGSVSGAKAGLFDGILGLFGLQAPVETKPDPLSYGKTYCVRLCDGRYYPLVSGNATPVAMCSAMCPASKTRIFRGGEIDNAVDDKGARYRDIEQAFAYRTNLVSGCTCNGKDTMGKDAMGLAPVDVMADPTLQPGDIVATADGLKVFQGAAGDAHGTAEFTPIAKSAWVSRDVRSRLSKVKVTDKR